MEDPALTTELPFTYIKCSLLPLLSYNPMCCIWVSSKIHMLWTFQVIPSWLQPFFNFLLLITPTSPLCSLLKTHFKAQQIEVPWIVCWYQRNNALKEPTPHLYCINFPTTYTFVSRIAASWCQNCTKKCLYTCNQTSLSSFSVFGHSWFKLKCCSSCLFI